MYPISLFTGAAGVASDWLLGSNTKWNRKCLTFWPGEPRWWFQTWRQLIMAAMNALRVTLKAPRDTLLTSMSSLDLVSERTPEYCARAHFGSYTCKLLLWNVNKRRTWLANNNQCFLFFRTIDLNIRKFVLTYFEF